MLPSRPLPRALCLPALLVSLSLLTPTGCRRRQEQKQPTSQPVSSAVTAIKIMRPAAPGSFVKLLERVGPAVVQILADVPVKRGPADWFVGATPGGVRSDERLLELHRAVGTGFII
ncbi:MAG: hypothetical protein JRH20_10895, partial [Deltaproteobacteria bacterium]|nr:hypothetical protein [Deltaproteobacteria bacterium]